MKQNNQRWKDNVIFYSVDRHPEEFTKYNIDSVPSFVILENDEVIEKFNGVVSYYYDEIQEFVAGGDNDD